MPKISRKKSKKKPKFLKRADKDQFILKNIGLVHKQARKYQRFVNNTSIAYDDLVQEGTIGLMTAYDRFKPRKGFQFSTYATYWIKARILRLLSRFYSTIHVTYSAGAIYDKLLNKYNKDKKGNYKQDVELAVTDIINRLTEDYSAGKIKYADYIKFINVLEAKQPLSFTHVPLNINGSDFTNSEYTSSAMNTFSEHSESIASSHVSEKLQYVEHIEQILGQKSILSKLLEELTEKENKFIVSYYGLNGVKASTYAILSKQLDIPKLQMHKYHEDILNKLKKLIKDWILSGDISAGDLFGGVN